MKIATELNPKGVYCPSCGGPSTMCCLWTKTKGRYWCEGGQQCGYFIIELEPGLSEARKARNAKSGPCCDVETRGGQQYWRRTIIRGEDARICKEHLELIAANAGGLIDK